MAGVVDVERFSLTLAAGTATASGTLTKGQTVVNCVPYMTCRMVTPPTTPDNPEHHAVDVYFSGNTVVVETDEFDVRSIVCEVTVVQYDGVRILVDPITFSLTTSEASTTEAITDIVDLDQAYIYCACQIQTANSLFETTALRARITSTTVATFDQSVINSEVSGHAWVVRSVSNQDFTVQPLSVTLADTVDLDNTGSITAVDEAKTFLMGSHHGGSGDDSNDSSIHCWLSGTGGTVDTVNVERQNTSGTISWSGFAVTFDSGGDEKVERGTVLQTAGTASENVDLQGTWDSDFRQVINSGQMTLPNCSTAGYASQNFPECRAAWDWVDNDTIRVQHYVYSSPSTDNRISYEAIQWSAGAASTPRRVMVVT